jgi:hypothetical protein
MLSSARAVYAFDLSLFSLGSVAVRVRFVVCAAIGIGIVSISGCATTSSTEAETQTNRIAVVAGGCKTTGSHIRKRECDDAVEVISRGEVERRLHDAEPQKPDPSRPLN